MAKQAVVAGVVDSDGRAHSPSARDQYFEVNRTDTGFYEITFEPEFEVVPAVNVVIWQKGVNYACNAVLYDITKDKVTIGTGDGGGSPRDLGFSFIAMDPRVARFVES